jgi:hypothetical protein
MPFAAIFSQNLAIPSVTSDCGVTGVAMSRLRSEISVSDASTSSSH